MYTLQHDNIPLYIRDNIFLSYFKEHLKLLKTNNIGLDYDSIKYRILHRYCPFNDEQYFNIFLRLDIRIYYFSSQYYQNHNRPSLMVKMVRVLNEVMNDSK